MAYKTNSGRRSCVRQSLPKSPSVRKRNHGSVKLSVLIYCLCLLKMRCVLPECSFPPITPCRWAESLHQEAYAASSGVKLSECPGTSSSAVQRLMQSFSTQSVQSARDASSASKSVQKPRSPEVIPSFEQMAWETWHDSE